MAVTDKDRIDGLMRLADFRLARWNARRDTEWKITLGFWGLLIGMAASIAGKFKPPWFWTALALLAGIILYARMWVGEIAVRNDEDQEWAFYYAEHAEQGLFPDTRIRPRPERQEVLPYLFSREGWAATFQIATSMVLALYAFWAISGESLMSWLTSGTSLEGMSPTMNNPLVIVTAALVLVTLGLVWITRKAMILSTRAWISVKSVTWENWNVAGQVPRVTIVLQNTGKSPANHVETSIDSDKRPQPRRSGPMPKLDWSDPQRTTLGPSMDVRYAWHFSENGRQYRPSEDDVKDIMVNRLFLFVYGETRYRDIFGRKRKTTWCFYNPEPGDPESTKRHCNVWNEAK